jgi:hypothetical protein
MFFIFQAYHGLLHYSPDLWHQLQIHPVEDLGKLTDPGYKSEHQNQTSRVKDLETQPGNRYMLLFQKLFMEYEFLTLSSKNFSIFPFAHAAKLAL